MVTMSPYWRKFADGKSFGMCHTMLKVSFEKIVNSVQLWSSILFCSEASFLGVTENAKAVVLLKRIMTHFLGTLIFFMLHLSFWSIFLLGTCHNGTSVCLKVGLSQRQWPPQAMLSCIMYLIRMYNCILFWLPSWKTCSSMKEGVGVERPLVVAAGTGWCFIFLSKSKSPMESSIVTRPSQQ